MKKISILVMMILMMTTSVSAIFIDVNGGVPSELLFSTSSVLEHGDTFVNYGDLENDVGDKLVSSSLDFFNATITFVGMDVISSGVLNYGISAPNNTDAVVWLSNYTFISPASWTPIITSVVFNLPNDFSDNVTFVIGYNGVVYLQSELRWIITDYIVPIIEEEVETRTGGKSMTPLPSSYLNQEEMHNNLEMPIEEQTEFFVDVSNFFDKDNIKNIWNKFTNWFGGIF